MIKDDRSRDFSLVPKEGPDPEGSMHIYINNAYSMLVCGEKKKVKVLIFVEFDAFCQQQKNQHIIFYSCCICQLKGSRIYEPIQQIWPQLITDSMLFLLKAKMTWTIHKSGHLLHSFSDTGETNLLNKKLKRHFLFKAFFDKSFSQISCECLLSPKNFSQERLLPRQVIEGFTTSIHIYSSKIF